MEKNKAKSALFYEKTWGERKKKTVMILLKLGISDFFKWMTSDFVRVKLLHASINWNLQVMNTYFYRKGFLKIL